VSHELIVKFEGGLADAHKLPAYNAAKYLVGLTRSILIPSAYLEDKKVHHRNIGNTRAYQLNLMSQRSGSFESVFEYLVNPAMLVVLDPLGAALAVEFVKDIIYSIIRRSIGQNADEKIEELESKGKLDFGDMAALVDAVTPAMRDAHTTIGSGAHNIYIINGSHNVIQLNATTKDYINTSINDDEKQVKDFSIARFNANTRNGGAYDYETRHTVAFILDDEADATTINSITESMRRYAHLRLLGNDDLSSRVSLKYTAIYTPDRKIKKIRILEARGSIREIGAA